MKPRISGLGRFASIALASLVLAACGSAPLRQSTSEMSGPVTANAAPTIVMPVALPDNPQPAYPSALLHDGQSATVQICCLVNAKGSVEQAIVQSSTNLAFNDPTLEIVRRWKFTPGTRDGVPTAMMAVVPVEFRPQSVAGP